MKADSVRISPLNSLFVRLLLAFGLVIVLTVFLVALLANRVTTQQFELYVSRDRQARAERLAPAFGQYYRSTGSWDGIQEALGSVMDLRPAGRGMIRGRPGVEPGLMGPGMAMGMGGQVDRLVVADAGRNIVGDTEKALVGRTLASADLERGVPIDVDGETVGTLLIAVPESVADPLQMDFLGQVNRALAIGGLVAGSVGILLGLVFARGLAAPLRALTGAAERLSGGDLSQRVRVSGTFEVAELGHAFNQMAASLAGQETLRRDLMAEIAHELRTPLSVLRAEVEALIDGVYEPGPERLASLQEEIVLLGRLVDDLRTLSLADAGQLQLRRETTSVRDILSAETAGFEMIAEAKRVRLDWNPPDDPLSADVDSHRLRQIVGNLLSNALRHTPPGGSISLRAAAEGPDAIEFVVADTGPGVAPEDVPHLFDRFWRSDTGSAGEGSGLGLAIVRRLSQAHRGEAWVESRPGRGAEFHVRIPRR